MNQKVQDDIVQWANLVFPNRTVQSGFLKLYEEMGEVLANPYNKEEWADVFILILDIMATYDIDMDGIGKAIEEKMIINLKRKWDKNDIGVMKHIED